MASSSELPLPAAVAFFDSTAPVSDSAEVRDLTPLAIDLQTAAISESDRR
jgi:hypothetical protein